MKIVIIGATGTVGSAVVKSLEDKHEIIKVGHSSGDLQLDMSQPSSIAHCFEQIGQFDALACASGKVAFKPFTDLTVEDWQIGLDNKLMGQVMLTQLAIKHLTNNGSITLISGILSEHPIAAGVSASTVNGALESFVKAASTELPKGIRINLISPTVLEESLAKYSDFFPGFPAVSAAKVAQAYVRSIAGVITGQTIKVYS